MPNVELPQCEFKIVLLGDTNTGKSCLALRFVEGYYPNEGTSATVGAFFLTKRITLNQMTSCKVMLWDTAGQAHFRRLAKTYYQQAAAAVLTYDVSQPQSLHRLRLLLEEVVQNTADRRMVLAIAACKTDLAPSLHHPGLQEQAQQLAREHNALYMATSSKTGEGVQSLFEQTAERVWQSHKEAVAGMGPSIPVVEGSHAKVAQLRSRSMKNSRSMDRAFVTPLQMVPLNHDDDDYHTPAPPDLQRSSSSHDEQSDEVVEEAASKRVFGGCDAGYFSCAGGSGQACAIM